ncbi:hypothetical protein [Niveibacterium sp. SC-1]|uniref:hypothetical protein n=1 Tax=Niveibacterium sp. SC-1 TaxID=3135646 RepID=UPI00311D7C51
MKRQKFASLPAYMRDFSRWPGPDEKALSRAVCEVFARRKAAMLAHLEEGMPISHAGARFHVDRNTLARCLDRALTVAAHQGEIIGFWAAVPRHRVVPYHRKLLFLGSATELGGKAGLFRAFLRQHPDIAQRLDDWLSKSSLSEVSPTVAHGQFRSLCTAYGVSGADYPLSNQDGGKRAIGRYLKEFYQRVPGGGLGATQSEEARLRAQIGLGVAGALRPDCAMDVLLVDECTLDVRITICWGDSKGNLKVSEIDRLSVIVAVDGSSGRIMAVYPYFGRSVSADYFREALQQVLSCLAPSQLLPAVFRGVPDPVDDRPRFIGWSTLWLDNALGHLDAGVISAVLSQVGGAINFGPVRRWYRRAAVERKIREVLRPFQSLPTTTGHSVTDPRRNRRPDISDTPLDWAHVVRMLFRTVADLNTLPGEGQGYCTPNSVFAGRLHDGDKPQLLRSLPLNRHDDSLLTTVVCTPTIRGSRTKGVQPYIQLDRAKYSGAGLANRWDLVGQKLLVSFDFRRYHSVRGAVEGTGEVIGELAAMYQWGYPHSRDMRRRVSERVGLRAQAEAEREDPVFALMAGVSADLESSPQKSRALGTELARTKLVDKDPESRLPPLKGPKVAPDSQKWPEDDDDDEGMVLA